MRQIGILNINKPKGKTSHDIVNIVRRSLGTKRVGHTGTLDPNATGVLPVCIGRATKFADTIMNGDKIYRAVLHLGITTDTQDITGTVIEKKQASISQEQILTTIKKYIGNIHQIPPMYSAIKINGQKLYDLAREGKTIERKPRPVTIYDIYDINFIDNNTIELSVHCTSGTYIRTLCHDIGQDLDVGGCMGDLVRLKSSNFTIENAISIQDLDDYEKHLIPVENLLEQYKNVIANQRAEKYLQNGNTINLGLTDTIKLQNNENVKLYNHKNDFFGLYKYIQSENKLKPIIYMG